MKTHEIPAGWRLNYWVARALGYGFKEYARDPAGVCYTVVHQDESVPNIGNVKLMTKGAMIDGVIVPNWTPNYPDYSADPRAFWPVIQRERISIDHDPEFTDACGRHGEVFACYPGATFGQYGEASHIAAMRCVIERAFGKAVGKEFE